MSSQRRGPIKLSLSLANTFGEGSDDDNDKEDRQQEASRGAVFAVGRGKAVGILIAAQRVARCAC